MFSPVSCGFLHAVVEEEGSCPGSCLVPNTIPRLLTHSLRNSSPQKNKKDLDMRSGLFLQMTHSPSFPILQGWQEDKWEALPRGLTLFPVGLSPFQQQELQADSYPKIS